MFDPFDPFKNVPWQVQMILFGGLLVWSILAYATAGTIGQISLAALAFGTSLWVILNLWDRRD